MTQEVTSLDKSKFCSVFQVDKDISFVMDSRDINFPVPMPTVKIIGMSRKTYSKKHPVAYNRSISYTEDTVLNSNPALRNKKSSVKNSPKCSSSSKVTKLTRKRPLDSTQSPVLKKARRKDVSSTKMSHTKVNGRISDRNKFHKSSQNVQTSFPAHPLDIEILDVFERKTCKTMKRDLGDSFSGRERNKDRLSDIQKKRNSKSLPTILKPCYPSNDDVPITEADIAPVIPSNSIIPDTSISEGNQDVNAQSQNKWLLPNGTSVVSSVQNGEMCSAKESDIKYNDKCNLYESETKVCQDKKNVGGRELKSLYENLNEICWAKEKNFQQMIYNNTDNRHSERITAKATDVGKNLRRLKAGNGNKLPLCSNKQNKSLANKNSAKLVLNRAKYGRLKPKLVVRKNPKSKAPLKNVKKVLTKPVIKPNKNLKVHVKSVQHKVNTKLKPVSGFKQKPQVSTSRNHLKVIGNAMKSKIASNSQSGLSSALKKNIVKTESGDMFSKSSSDGKVIKKFENIEFAKEVEYLNKSFGDNKIFTTAVKKGSKLRVSVEPLEHTNLWNSDFCETFSKFVLEQSSSQMGMKSQDSIRAMFDELMESWFHPPDNSKFLKKKKPEEETLRSSVRQSEGAFRYKEIVVKKHENYMQFILVPNVVKQNSLSIEAMKELKEAFLLAKKDPNCRGVLLNSSGTFFCSGIDLSLLIGNNKKQVAEEMASTIKELVLTLSTFTKPVVAAVNGTAVGFGVSLLTFCDVVLASDKATFCIPATRLGYIPEGAVTLTLPQVVGSTVAAELLLYGRRLTAEQAVRHGLVSEVLWHSHLMNEVIPRVKAIVSQPLQVMEATKTMVRCQLWDKVKFHMEREWRLLPSLWLDAECQNNIKRALQNGWLID